MKRTGLISPSAFSDMMSRGRGKDEDFGKTAHTLARRLAMERMGVVIPEISAPALSWGNDHEAAAIDEFQRTQFEKVTPTDRIHLDKYVGGTPDGLIGEDGLIEIKCPFNPDNHLQNLLNGMQIKQYNYQMQGYMWITGRKYCKFVSYDPRFKIGKRIAVWHIDRDEDIIKELADRCIEFNKIVKSYEV